jgi:hypothetical protein
MDFSEAEQKFNELQARVQRGEPLSEEQYQEELARLMVQDDHGTFWSLEPGTGRWLFFDGTEWIPGNPPRAGRAYETLPPPPAEPLVAPSPEPEPAPVREPGSVTSESVQTYVRDEQEYESPDRPGGVAPRPVREPIYTMGADERPWLPFAIGAVFLLLCAVILFFGVRGGLPFLGSAAARVTPTESPTTEATATAEVIVVPTDTPVATATKAAVAATPKAVTVTATDKVRVRSGPGTSYEVLSSLAQGTTVKALARNGDSSWIQVQLEDGTKGWVSAEFVTVNGDVNSLPVAQAPAPKVSPTPTKKGAKPAPTATPAG